MSFQDKRMYQDQCIVVRVLSAVTSQNGDRPDPYCKLQIIDDSKAPFRTPSAIKRHKRKRSSVIKKTFTPQWNETFEFTDVRPSTAKLLIGVYNMNKISKSNFLGDALITLSSIPISSNVYPAKSSRQLLNLQACRDDHRGFIIVEISYKMNNLLKPPCDCVSSFDNLEKKYERSDTSFVQVKHRKNYNSDRGSESSALILPLIRIDTVSDNCGAEMIPRNPVRSASLYHLNSLIVNSFINSCESMPSRSKRSTSMPCICTNILADA